MFTLDAITVVARGAIWQELHVAVEAGGLQRLTAQDGGQLKVHQREHLREEFLRGKRVFNRK